MAVITTWDSISLKVAWGMDLTFYGTKNLFGIYKNGPTKIWITTKLNVLF
jgi:hypothetical protein